MGHWFFATVVVFVGVIFLFQSVGASGSIFPDFAEDFLTSIFSYGLWAFLEYVYSFFSWFFSVFWPAILIYLGYLYWKSNGKK